MRLSQRQKNILRHHGFSAMYVIGPESSVVYSTQVQAEALQVFLEEPRIGHNRPPQLEDFITIVHPVRIGSTSNPADSIASTGDGWSWEWEYKLLGRVWFENKSQAEIFLHYIQDRYIGMRKSWVKINGWPGRELFDLELVILAREIGFQGLNDYSMLLRLEEIEHHILAKEDSRV
jgi:hypothetical protein